MGRPLLSRSRSTESVSCLGDGTGRRRVMREPGGGGEERGMNIVTAAFKHKNHLRDNCRTLTNAGCPINGCDMRIIGSHNSSRTIGDHGSAGGGPEQPTCKKRKTKQKGTQQNEDKQTTAVCQPRMETGRQLVNRLST